VSWSPTPGIGLLSETTYSNGYCEVCHLSVAKEPPLRTLVSCL
jgi:hypothetical protein